MSDRNYLPPETLIPRRDGDRHAPPHDHRIIHHHHNSALLEEEIAVHQRHIQTLLVENQRFATTHVELKRQIDAARQDLRQLTAAAPAFKADCDAEVREVYESSIRAESEIGAVDGIGANLAQVKDDVEKMRADRDQFAAKLKEIEDELVKVRPELELMKEIKTDIAALQKEINKGRAAVEYEKKMQTINHEQSEIMEKNMMSTSCEIERLRADIANAENRARGVAAVATQSQAYPAGYGIPAAGYGGNMYPNAYSAQQVPHSANAGKGYGGVHYNPYGS